MPVLQANSFLRQIYILQPSALKPIQSPGITPAINTSVTETPAITAYMIRFVLGGIIAAKVAAAETLIQPKICHNRAFPSGESIPSPELQRQQPMTRNSRHHHSRHNCRHGQAASNKSDDC